MELVRGGNSKMAHLDDGLDSVPGGPSVWPPREHGWLRRDLVQESAECRPFIYCARIGVDARGRRKDARLRLRGC